ncbi:GNAT family N-acetyltransferase [Pseudalkalibacillus hwajinpoensis]|uniref:N-acetyltransferase n=1 Tax=Guptibacillus hwajinpoensis TaxID=208199 RepID=A0A4U1MIA0_9BACL|nr:N-acetyltransferase [Pseudalkalibacillus hwajinpoensis]TKD70517.1 N-acetyltransferase [Pseudalkalibacillus hwajinpoensis]
MIEIREENVADHEAISTILREAFNGEDEVQLVNGIRESEGFIPELALVALHNRSEPVGYILFSIIEIHTEKGSIPSLALAPVAVVPELQNEGVGSLLIKDGMMRATSLGYRHVVVLGHKDYYPKFGFVPASEENITGPFNAGDSFMVRELKKESLKDVSGEVVYPSAFGV